MKSTLGLIGLGEAGSSIAAGLHDTTSLTIVGFHPRARERAFVQRASRLRIDVVDSLAELARRCEVIVCLTSAASARGIAEGLSRHLGERHIYADWNSASPRLKSSIADVIEATGALFVDGAIMAAVPPHRHAVPVLVSGSGAQELVEWSAGLGMQVETVGNAPGQASAVKMFRALLGKGLEALLLECLLGAHRYGAAERVLASLNDLDTSDWSALASYLLQRSVIHGRRRSEELGQVAVTLSDVGVEPMLADSAARRLRWLADLGIPPDLAADSPSHDQLIALVLAAIRAGDDHSRTGDSTG